MQSLHLSHYRRGPVAATLPAQRRPVPRRPARRCLGGSAGVSKDPSPKAGTDVSRGAGAGAEPPAPPLTSAFEAICWAMDRYGAKGNIPPTPSEALADAETLLTHLPNASVELAATADLTLSIGGRQLPLHSAVLASGARVLCTALCAAGIRGDLSAKAAVVQQGFDGRSLEDATNFLRVLYNVFAADDMTAAQLEGVLALANKLDAPAVLQACDARLCFLFNAAPTVDPFTAEAAPTSNVAARWLAVADRYRLRRLLPLAAEKVLRSMTVLPVSKSEGKDWKSMIEELGGASLSAGTWQLLFEGMARAAAAVQAQGYSSCKLNDHIPNTFKSWSKPGDLF